MRSHILKLLSVSTAITLAFGCVRLSAEGCNAPELANQKRDAATVQRLENAFAVAFLKGDTDFEKCLILPDYAEISRSGKWRELPDLLASTAKNQGKNLSMPAMPKIDVLVHGDAAIAHGSFTVPEPDGKSLTTRFSDVYVWKDNAWHVLYSQQTPADAN